MKIVLLSGGKGKRLWPVSTDKVPKQFIKVFSDASSMLSKTYNLVLKKSNKEDIYIATGREYGEDVKKELNDFSNFIFEPAYIGTFGAILNVAAFLEENSSLDEIISIVPIDHNVGDNFYDNLYRAEELLKNSTSNICLIGIKPTFPSEQYGYILHENNKVLSFAEKPNEDTAINLIHEDALWNSGIVVFKLKGIVELAKKYFDYKNYEDFLNNYSNLPHNSFDKEVLEKTKDISIIKCDDSWNDIGTWEVLAPIISKPDKYNTNIINFEDKEIVNDGVRDAIIINSPNGLKIIPKDRKEIIHRIWGYYEILNEFKFNEVNIKIKRLTILPNKNISYQYHHNRGENWYILDGDGEVIIDNKLMKANEGDIFSIGKEKKHSIRALSKLTILEVQYGPVKHSETDIVRIETEWDKILEII